MYGTQCKFCGRLGSRGRKRRRYMNLMLKILSGILNKLHMKINKTKTMTVRSDQTYTRPHIKHYNSKSRTVICYLESTITYNSNFIIDTKKKKNSSSQTFMKNYNLLTSKHFNIKTKKKIIKIFVWSVLLYDCETWTIKKMKRIVWRQWKYGSGEK